MKHRHSHLVLLVIAILLAVFMFVLYGYMRHTVAASLGRALAARETAQKGEWYKRQGQELTALYQDTRADRARIKSLFVSSDATIPFIESLESFGDKAGSTVELSLIDADDLDGKPVGTTGSIRARVDVRGSWTSVMKTLLLTETLPYRITLSHVLVDTSGTPATKGANPEWHASFDISALMIKTAK